MKATNGGWIGIPWSHADYRTPEGKTSIAKLHCLQTRMKLNEVECLVRFKISFGTFRR